MAYDPLSGIRTSPAPAPVTPNVAYRPESGTTISGYTSISEYVDRAVANMPSDLAGKFAGYEYSADKKLRRARYHDGRGGFTYGPWESNPDYKDTQKKTVTYAMLDELLKSYNITGLATTLEDIRKEYPDASTEDILFLLQFDSRYNAKFNERFKANAQRQAAGLTVLKPDTYIKLEQGYKKIFDNYGLTSFNNQSYYDSLIAGDLDVTEVTNRVTLAFDRVLGDKEITSAFKKFYPSLTASDIVTGMLDPKNQYPALERKVKAAEIGGAALRQNLMAFESATTEEQRNVPFSNVTRATLGAETLAGQGVSKSTAETQYKAIAELLPAAEKLSSIYGDTTEQYGLLEAEQERLQGLASAARKRQKISELELMQFKKTSGLAKGALSSQLNI